MLTSSVGGSTDSEVTEVTAAELSRDVEEENGSNSEELASERFVGAAVPRM